MTLDDVKRMAAECSLPPSMLTLQKIAWFFDNTKDAEPYLVSHFRKEFKDWMKKHSVFLPGTA